MEFLAKKMADGFKTVSHQLVQLTGETAYIRTDIDSIKADTNILKSDVNTLKDKTDGLEKKVDNLQKEMNQRFDINNDTHREILQAIDEMTNAKITSHCKTYHAVEWYNRNTS